MEKKYIIGIDQSTQGTKALLIDNSGKVLCRQDIPHRQIINELGWVSHDPLEIYYNTILVVKNLIVKSNISKDEIKAIGISNQRETSVIWNRKTGEPLANAIVWQCARATQICERKNIKANAQMIQQRTGMNLSPYFPASKITWLLENIEGAQAMADKHEICHGTIDSWLVFKLTGGRVYKTDYSNASRTQLFNIHTLTWDEEICRLFNIDPLNLAEVTDSDGDYGKTTFDGYFQEPVPIRAVMGDSHAALFGQGCLKPGMIKATYGTGSSIMMNIGDKPVISTHGVVTSLAYSISGKVNYVLEGNLNYTGAVVTWLKDDMKLVASPAETYECAVNANKDDNLYLVPAFTGLGAPYWQSHAKACIIGMDRTTTRNELVRAGLECIAYQITDVVRAMEEDARVEIKEIRADGGPTKNRYLSQFQSDILNAAVLIPDSEELSGMGVAYLAGIKMKLWDYSIFEKMSRTRYCSEMTEDVRNKKYNGWKQAVNGVIGIYK